MATETPTVETLLHQSVSAHQRYRAAVKAQQRAVAKAALGAAALLRHDADALDPSHQDPTWAALERDHPHAPLTHFYAVALTPPPDPCPTCGKPRG